MHILVTGATGGIGQAVCEALAADGASLSVAASRPGPRLDALVQALRAQGGAAQGFGADLTDPAAAKALVLQAVQAQGPLDALVCVAGASGPGRLEDLSLAQWDQTFALNTRAVFLMAQAALASLRAQGGSITAIASMSGLHPHPGYGAYSPAKAALVMLCRQIAQEWGPLGVRCNSVCPGMIRTPLTEPVYQSADTRQARQALVPLGRIGQAQDVAQAVRYLVSPQAAYVNGHNLVVDGGVSDRMLAMIPGRPGKPPLPDANA